MKTAIFNPMWFNAENNLLAYKLNNEFKLSTCLKSRMGKIKIAQVKHQHEYKIKCIIAQAP